MNTKCTNSRQEVLEARQDTTDWARLSTAERIRAIELEGYVVIPDLLSPTMLSHIREELGRLPTTAVDYSENQRGSSDVQWTESPHTIDVIALEPIIAFLTALLGDELLCTSCGYANSQPGHPGIAIHTDCQPYGSQIFGMLSSSPCLVRVLYYLDELTPLRSPLKVIPRSHLSLHADANPYHRFLAHDEEVMVTCKAGSAAVINQKLFHGNYPNYSDDDRRLLGIAYRPAWAGPISAVPEFDSEKVAKLPSKVRKFFKSLNTQKIDFNVPNRPDNLATKAAGIGPSRWNGASTV